jgi:hypothetical protein
LVPKKHFRFFVARIAFLTEKRFQEGKYPMDIQTGDEDPPKSTDLDGWRKAIADNRLKTFRLEVIAAAFQDLGTTDPQVQHALTKHLSDSIIRMLRRKVGFNHPNQGEDIIFRVHGDIFEALMLTKSADGRGLREAFGSRVLFRMKDAIITEQRERRTPADFTFDKKGTPELLDKEVAEEVIQVAAAAELLETDVDANSSDDYDRHYRRGAARDDETTERNEQFDVDRILECVSDPKKRLAFHLHMHGVPYKTKQENVQSIARALNISEKTARGWVEEVRLFLEQNEGAKSLKKMRAGERL